LNVWGVDSGIRHAVSGSDYTSVRTGAFMGYRMIAALAGLRAEPADEPGVVRIDDPQWAGYLANLSPAEFDRGYAKHLPVEIRGDEFLRKYGGTTDRVTRVEPDRTYAVRQPTGHPVYEHARVGRFRELLASRPSDEVLAEMGDLMCASHNSYSACGLASDGTDRLVHLVREAGPAAGLYGAKITGGGSGGTVAILGRAEAAGAVAAVADRYRQESGRPAHLFSGSSPGAYAFGVRTLASASDIDSIIPSA
jgi:L-arabinokinase